MVGVGEGDALGDAVGEVELVGEGEEVGVGVGDGVDGATPVPGQVCERRISEFTFKISA